jgi:hypothetical protein
MKKISFLAFFCLICFFSFGQSSPIRPDSFEWGDNPGKFIGKTIILNAFIHQDNRVVIFQQEDKGRCYKTFEEQKTGLKFVINIPQRFWDNNGSMIPKKLGMGLYQLTLSVNSVKPVGVCDGDVVSAAIGGPNKIFYILQSISRYNM